MKRTPLAVWIGLGLACATACADWPGWRGANRDGVDDKSPALSRVTPDAVLEPAWLSEKIPSGGDGGWSSPVIHNGKVYLFTHTRQKIAGAELGPPKFPWLPPDKRGHLTPQQYEQYERNRRDEDQARGKAFRFAEIVWCLDLATGKTLWKASKPSVYTRFVQSGTLLIDHGRIYVQGAGRVARCLDLKNGQKIWETRLPGDFRDQFMMSSFAVADGVAAVLAGHLFALDAKTGDLLWQGDKRQTRGSHSSPIVWRQGGKSYFIVNVAGDTACFEPRTGKQLWRVDSMAGLSTPVLAGDRLITYGQSRRGGLRCYKVSPGGAEHQWTYQGVADNGSSPVVVGGHVYVQGGRRLACVDLKTGDEKWMTTLIRYVPEYTSLIAADGKVLYALEGVLWFKADPTSYKPILEAKFDEQGVIATKAAHYKRFKLDDLAKTPQGQKKAEDIYHKKVSFMGPMRCASPAITDGRLIIRRRTGLACYDLRGRAAK